MENQIFQRHCLTTVVHSLSNLFQFRMNHVSTGFLSTLDYLRARYFAYTEVNKVSTD